MHYRQYHIYQKQSRSNCEKLLLTLNSDSIIYIYISYNLINFNLNNSIKRILDFLNFVISLEIENNRGNKLINNNNNKKKPTLKTKVHYKQERKSEKERILLGRVKQQERTTMREKLEEVVENNKRWKGRDSWGSDSCKRRTAKFKRNPRTLVKRKIRRKLKEVGRRLGGTKWKKYGESSEKSPNVSAKKFEQKLLRNYEKCRWRIEEKKVKKYIKTTVTATE